MLCKSDKPSIIIIIHYMIHFFKLTLTKPLHRNSLGSPSDLHLPDRVVDEAEPLNPPPRRLPVLALHQVHQPITDPRDAALQGRQVVF